MVAQALKFQHSESTDKQVDLWVQGQQELNRGIQGAKSEKVSYLLCSHFFHSHSIVLILCYS